MLLIAEICHSCFACHLQTVHPIPVIFISISTEIISPFQWNTWFTKFMPCSFFSLPAHAYALHTTSRISCHVYVVVVYFVVYFFTVLLLRVSSDNVAIVRIRLSTSVCLLHGLVLLPCGISGKMTIPSKSLLCLLASCSLFCYAYAAIPTTCLSCLPYCQTKPLTHLLLANHCLAMLPLCSALLIALLVVGEDEVCSLLEHGDVVP